MANVEHSKDGRCIQSKRIYVKRLIQNGFFMMYVSYSI